MCIYTVCVQIEDTSGQTCIYLCYICVLILQWSGGAGHETPVESITKAQLGLTQLGSGECTNEQVFIQMKVFLDETCRKEDLI